mmetsp:Transcript_2598/g.4460  ORF Transcript_2598/g.4460 Transcript_2598/m.4460 type:complete len:150 (+) Transcript_2598:235-684(+)
MTPTKNIIIQKPGRPSQRECAGLVISMRFEMTQCAKVLLQQLALAARAITRSRQANNGKSSEMKMALGQLHPTKHDKIRSFFVRQRLCHRCLPCASLIPEVLTNGLGTPIAAAGVVHVGPTVFGYFFQPMSRPEGLSFGISHAVFTCAV